MISGDFFAQAVTDPRRKDDRPDLQAHRLTEMSGYF